MEKQTKKTQTFVATASNEGFWCSSSFFYCLFSPPDIKSHIWEFYITASKEKPKLNCLKIKLDPDVLFSPSAHRCRCHIEQLLLYTFNGVHMSSEVPHMQPYWTALAEPSDEKINATWFNPFTTAYMECGKYSWSISQKVKIQMQTRT